jgi:hypothetical protein
LLHQELVEEYNCSEQLLIYRQLSLMLILSIKKSANPRIAIPYKEIKLTLLRFLLHPPLMNLHQERLILELASNRDSA